MDKKNILVLTGSPRKNGNSDRMANAFIQGALSVGHEVVKFESARKEIDGCKACKTCWKKGKPCSFDDSFNELAPLLEAADVLVFSTPLYWFGFPAQIKAAIDKMNAYLVDNCKTPLKIKGSLLLVCGGDEGMKIFDGIITTYRQIASYMKWEEKGVLAVPNVSEKGDIEATDALLKAEEYGKSL
ncbi:flavodoxin family protein [Desulfosporosinus nitroreducens]|uniref:Flavodoxin family protein n=1 Tax=Desulfosporosinus nitroreducens TaxID=2018668 RepID=A0ABT8QMR1_9FIRM|nr:flavodoxin family protein [Desulfosporosinus nitroreducens]MCO1603887.1 flavodoxin family protein [Desulfosporosinus nitroreducens]MDO0822621.1 flavodoxin family protein [Desulfosporosinus nitroreducens]